MCAGAGRGLLSGRQGVTGVRGGYAGATQPPPWLPAAAGVRWAGRKGARVPLRSASPGEPGSGAGRPGPARQRCSVKAHAVVSVGNRGWLGEGKAGLGAGGLDVPRSDAVEGSESSHLLEPTVPPTRGESCCCFTEGCSGQLRNSSKPTYLPKKMCSAKWWLKQEFGFYAYGHLLSL